MLEIVLATSIKALWERTLRQGNQPFRHNNSITIKKGISIIPLYII